jgi:hypothetical protein
MSLLQTAEEQLDLPKEETPNLLGIGQIPQTAPATKKNSFDPFA